MWFSDSDVGSGASNSAGNSSLTTETIIANPTQTLVNQFSPFLVDSLSVNFGPVTTAPTSGALDLYVVEIFT